VSAVTVMKGDVTTGSRVPAMNITPFERSIRVVFFRSSSIPMISGMEISLETRNIMHKSEASVKNKQVARRSMGRTWLEALVMEVWKGSIFFTSNFGRRSE